MTKIVKTAQAISWGPLLTLVLLVGHAAAAPLDENELSRWVPSISLETDLSFNKAQGQIQTTDVAGPFYEPPNPPATPVPIQPIIPTTPAEANTYMVTPSFGLTAELMTPAWFDWPGRPRFFVHGDVIVAFGPNYSIPAIGKPGPLGDPGGGVALQDETVLGQGAYTQGTVQPLQAAAGAGIAFSTEWGGRAVRFKPSIEYLRQEVKVQALASRAVKYQQEPGAGLGNFRQILISGQSQRVYDGIGPGFQLEVDTARKGSLVVSLYGSIKAWAFLNNEPIEVKASNQNAFSVGCRPNNSDPINPNNPLLCSGEQGDFSFERDQWGFGGAFGLRFRWVPEKRK